MKQFFTNLGLKFQQFMTGRYGPDKLFRALLTASLIIMLVSSIVSKFSKIAYYAIYIAALALFAYAFFRMFSKNIQMRSHENQQYLKFINSIKASFTLTKTKFTQRKTHKFVKCSKCKKVLRLPKHKGKIKVSCPHCANEFIINTGKKK